MKSIVSKSSPTSAVITINLVATDLAPIVRHTYNEFRTQVKAAGFRPGRAPDHIVEKEIGTQPIHNHVIEDAASKFYSQAVKANKLRPAGNPEVEIKKFVPFESLEMHFTTEVVGEIKLTDYKKIKKSQPEVKVADKEVDQVLASLRSRAAERSEVKRPAKTDDEIIIDMQGTRDGKAVPGTEAKDYAVLIGSGRFVPGFETNLTGLKSGDKKEFNVTFPKDYPEPTLQAKEVKFKVEVKKVSELKLPVLNDDFVKTVGPFNTLTELKADIKKQLEIEKAQDSRRRLTDEVVDEVVAKTQVEIPPGLISRQQEQLWTEFEQNVKNQGQELDAYLTQEKKSKADIEKLLNKEAQKRVKTALVLSEVANQEKLEVTPEELEMRLQILKGRYQDKQMQTQLDKPEAKKDIADQLLIEKTVDILLSYATK